LFPHRAIQAVDQVHPDLIFEVGLTDFFMGYPVPEVLGVFAMLSD
jgi:hypothetical protein